MPRLLALTFAALICAPSLALAQEAPPPVRPPPPPPTAAPGDDAAAGVPPAGAQVSRETFEARLSPYGRWVNTPEYGRVWVPGGVAADWRPYTYGRWVMTDWGWTWVSDEPWGWGPYHYGRWYSGSFGWYWVPGRVWGPAWVSWRWNHGYVAWAPMGPRGVTVYAVSSPYWVTVQSQHFTSPIRTVALAPAAQVTVLSQTRPLAGPYASPKRGVFGPPAAEIARATGRPVVATPVNRVLPGAMAHATSGNLRATPNPNARNARPPGAPGINRAAPLPGVRRGGGRRRR